MEAILKFNPSKEDDRFEYYCATKGKDMFGFLCEFQDWLRRRVKYPDEKELKRGYETVEEIYEHFNDELLEYQIDLEQ